MSKPAAYSYIRFSTPKQQWGDSVRRQTELSKKYAEKCGLVLDDKLDMQDSGLSGFHGVNRTKGALGKFLELVKVGKIEKGSILILEELDRLTRQELLEAVHMFTGLLLAGIEIHSIVDEMSYTPESFDFGQMVISAMKLSQGHEESRKKSARLKEAWKAKREKAANGGKKLGRKCPAWLKLSDDGTFYEEIPERAPIIKKIYRMKFAGKSSKRIAQEFNMDQNFPWRPRSPRHGGVEGWWPSYIEKILRTRAVIGEFQPHQLTEGKRQPVGEPQQNYFPVVITEELFYSVQEIFEKSRVATKHGGKVGNAGNHTFSNIFVHLAKCGYCGASMHLLDKSPGRYYVCSSALRRNGCDYLSVPYPEVESTILRYCKGLNPADLLLGREETENLIRMLRGQLSTIEGKIETLTRRASNLGDEIADIDDREYRKMQREKLLAILHEKADLEQQQPVLQRELEAASTAEHDVREHLHSLSQLFDSLGSFQGQELIDLKLRLRQEVKRLINWIKIYPEGDQPMTEQVKGALREMYEKDRGESHYESLKGRIEYQIANAKNELKIVIEFKSWVIRVIYPRRGIREFMEMDEDFGTAITEAVYKQGRGGESLEYDEEDREILEEHYGVEF